MPTDGHIEIDMKAGSRFETFDRDDNHCKLIIINSKIGANVPVIYDPIAKKVVTILPRKAVMKKYLGWDTSRRKRAPKRERVRRRR